MAKYFIHTLAICILLISQKHHLKTMPKYFIHTLSPSKSCNFRFTGIFFHMFCNVIYFTYLPGDIEKHVCARMERLGGGGGQNEK